MLTPQDQEDNAISEVLRELADLGAAALTQDSNLARILQSAMPTAAKRAALVRLATDSAQVGRLKVAEAALDEIRSCGGLPRDVVPLLIAPTQRQTKSRGSYAAKVYRAVNASSPRTKAVFATEDRRQDFMRLFSDATAQKTVAEWGRAGLAGLCARRDVLGIVSYFSQYPPSKAVAIDTGKVLCALDVEPAEVRRLCGEWEKLGVSASTEGRNAIALLQAEMRLRNQVESAERKAFLRCASNPRLLAEQMIAVMEGKADRLSPTHELIQSFHEQGVIVRGKAGETIVVEGEAVTIRNPSSQTWNPTILAKMPEGLPGTYRFFIERSDAGKTCQFEGGATVLVPWENTSIPFAVGAAWDVAMSRTGRYATGFDMPQFQAHVDTQEHTTHVGKNSPLKEEGKYEIVVTVSNVRGNVTVTGDVFAVRGGSRVAKCPRSSAMLKSGEGQMRDIYRVSDTCQAPKGSYLGLTSMSGNVTCRSVLFCPALPNRAGEPHGRLD